MTEFNDEKTYFKFTRLEDRQPGESWILMVYGPTKSGKTYFAGTAGPRTLFINIGEGIETLLSPAFTTKYPESKRMITVDLRQMKDSKETVFNLVCDVINHALEKFPNEFDTVVVDEATAFRKYALVQAMNLVTANRTKKRLSPTEEYVKADVQDFGVEMDMIEWFCGQYIPKFKGYGKNFLMLAHEAKIFGKPDSVGGEAPLLSTIPAFTGKKFPDKVPSFFDDVFKSQAIEVGTGQMYRLRTNGNDSVIAGTRHGGIFNAIESNPNFLEMWQRIKSGQAKPKK